MGEQQLAYLLTKGVDYNKKSYEYVIRLLVVKTVMGKVGENVVTYLVPLPPSCRFLQTVLDSVKTIL